MADIALKKAVTYILSGVPLPVDPDTLKSVIKALTEQYNVAEIPDNFGRLILKEHAPACCCPVCWYDLKNRERCYKINNERLKAWKKLYTK